MTLIFYMYTFPIFKASNNHLSNDGTEKQQTNAACSKTIEAHISMC